MYTYVRSLGCQCWEPGNARWLCPLRLSRASIPAASLAPIYPLSCVFSSSPLTSTTPPLSLSPSLSPSLSLMRLIDPDLVLFFSLFDSRRVTRTDSPAASRRQGLLGGGAGGGGQDHEVVGGMGRTGPTHRFRDIHFHFIFLSEIGRKREIQRKRKEQRRSSGGRERGVGKNFGHSPEAVDRPASLSGPRDSEFAIFATSWQRDREETSAT